MTKLEESMGEAFEQSRYWQRVCNRAFYSLAGATALIGVADFAIVSENKIPLTLGTFAGSGVIYGIAKVHDRLQDHFQNTIMKFGMRDFDEPTDEQGLY